MSSEIAPALDVLVPTPVGTEGPEAYLRDALVPFLADEFRLIRKALNNISILNMSAHYQTGITTPGVANTQFTITHNLGRIPKIVIWDVDQAAIIYDDARNTWTDSVLYLKCNVATVGLTVLVI